MLSKWPEYKEEWNFPAEEAAIEHCKDLVKGIRNVRTEMMFRHQERQSLILHLRMQGFALFLKKIRKYM